MKIDYTRVILGESYWKTIWLVKCKQYGSRQKASQVNLNNNQLKNRLVSVNFISDLEGNRTLFKFISPRWITDRSFNCPCAIRHPDDPGFIASDEADSDNTLRQVLKPIFTIQFIAQLIKIIKQNVASFF